MIKRNLRKKIIFAEDAVANAIKNLPTGKASVSNDIPVFIIKETIDVYSQKITQIMNDCLKNNFFPDILKNAEITPCFKKGDKGEKENFGGRIGIENQSSYYSEWC